MSATLYDPSLTHPSTPAASVRRLSKILSSAGPEQVTNERHFAKRIKAFGFKAAGTVNANSIWVGRTSTGQQELVEAGKNITLEAESGAIDTTDLYVRGTSTDGVYIEFQEGFK